MFLKRIKLFLKFVLAIIIFAICIEFIYRAALKIEALITCRSNKKDFNLCMVGGSTALGIPFNEKVSIPKMVSYAFKDSINKQKIVIHNLAKAGMPISTAYWKTRQLTLGIDSGTMLLYVGINDPYINENKKCDFDFKFMHHSWVISKIYYLINPWDISKQNYEFYYEEIVKMLQDKGWVIINSSLVGNFSAFSPNINDENYFYNISDDIHTKDSLSLNSKLLNEKSPFSFYKKGHYYLNRNLTDSANKYFQFAVDQDYSIRPSSYKNQFIKNISEKHQLYYVDPFNLFLTKSGNTLPGYNLFMDAHHPNLEGYIFISNLFIDEIETINSTKKSNSVTLENIEFAFNLDNEFYGRVNIETAAWHISESFFSLYYQDRIDKAQHYLEKTSPSEALLRDYNYWKCLLLLLQEDFFAWDNFYEKHKEEMNFSYPLKNMQNFDRVEEKINLGLSKGLITEELAKNYLLKLN